MIRRLFRAFMRGLRPKKASKRRPGFDPSRCDVCRQRISFCPYACGMCIACCPGHPEIKRPGEEDDEDEYTFYRTW